MPVPQSMRRLVRARAHRYCEYCHADERWQFIRIDFSPAGSFRPGRTATAQTLSSENRSGLTLLISPDVWLRQGISDPATVLRKARLRYIKQKRSSNVWAPYVLVER